MARLVAVHRCAAPGSSAGSGRQRWSDLHAGDARRNGCRRRRSGRGRVGERCGGQRKRGADCEEQEKTARHPPTIFWMIVIAAGANNANAKPNPALAIAPFAFSIRIGSPPAIT